MTVGTLIKALEKYPKDLKINIFDWKQNLHNDWGEGSSAGIYTEFEIEEFFTESKTPWLSLSFSNDDYTEEGIKREAENVE